MRSRSSHMKSGVRRPLREGLWAATLETRSLDAGAGSGARLARSRRCARVHPGYAQAKQLKQVPGKRREVSGLLAEHGFSRCTSRPALRLVRLRPCSTLPHHPPPSYRRPHAVTHPAAVHARGHPMRPLSLALSLSCALAATSPRTGVLTSSLALPLSTSRSSRRRHHRQRQARRRSRHRPRGRPPSRGGS